MLKERLYYQDAYRKSFTALVVKEATDEQNRLYIVLDNTAFYPTGGGQPHDSGTIDGVRVVDVDEVDGEIRHFIEEPLNATGEVTGIIDWERRFDHMQQHAGQHILTAAFVELFGFQTTSFHLGKDVVSIDLNVEEVTPEQLKAVERVANQIILENRSIETKWVTENELHQYTLRKLLAVTDGIRLVIIPEFDYNGCGGTHPSSTGQVVALKILSTEKQKRKARIQFVCGGRVLDQLHWRNEELSTASKLLSAPLDGVSVAVEKVLESNHSLEKELEQARESLMAYEAENILSGRDGQVVRAAFTDRTVQELQKLARLLVEKADDLIVLLVAENDDRLQFIAARGTSVEVSMKQIASTVLPALNGKGGGNDAFVQGGGERTVDGDALLRLMAEAL